MSQQGINPRDRQVLYDYWDGLPRIKVVSDAQRIYYKHDARVLINKVLGLGISDEIGEKEYFRRAMNAQEIHQKILQLGQEFDTVENINLKEFSISLENLYYHLKAMEKEGLIQVITILKEGRHNIAYYGRVAKIMIFGVDFEEYDKVKNAFSAMNKVLPLVHPGLDPSVIDEFYTEYVSIGKTLSQKLFQGLPPYEKAMDKTDVDIGDILNFLELLSSTHADYIALFDRIKKKLGIAL